MDFLRRELLLYKLIYIKDVPGCMDCCTRSGWPAEVRICSIFSPKIQSAPFLLGDEDFIRMAIVKGKR